MKRFLALLALAAPLFLAGCATTGGGLAARPNAERSSLAVFSDDPSKLSVCLFAASGVGGSAYERDLIRSFVRYAGNGGNYLTRVGQPYFRSAQTVTSLDDPRDCDVTVRVSHPGFTIFSPVIVDVYSTRTQQQLLHFEVDSAQRSNDLATPVRDAVGPDTRLYKRLMAEREKEAGAAPAAAAAVRPSNPEIVSDVDTPSYSGPENGRDLAVVVGVEHYSNLPKAEFADRDARAVSEHLRALGYPPRNILLLIDQEATRASLARALNSWLPNRVGEDSTVFFYYSGHGAPDVKTDQAYLVPVDGDPEDLTDTAYPVNELYRKLDALKAKHVVVALDSCFSGAGGRSVLAKGVRPLVTKIQFANLAPGKVVSLSASKGDEISGTLAKQGHGLFTYYLLKGLNGAALDHSGHVTLDGLYDYLAPKVEDAARLQNRDQTPQLMPGGAAQAENLVLR
ncbi:MAG: caspase family protein [Elusimicrobia bacterium]|nr:caspase family protein [Elusimicrobiota bacterium]MDE2426812.1 caspase family protein [Elusimicrobiota bacterium]